MSCNAETISKLVIETLENEGVDTAENISDIIEEKAFASLPKNYFTRKELFESINRLKADFLGFGVLQPLFDDSTVTEIMVNSREIYYEKEGQLFKSGIKMDSREELMGIIRAICRRTGRPVNTAVPITDACLDDGTRINIVLEPIAVDGAALTIRKFPDDPISGRQLIEGGFITREALGFLKDIYSAKYNMFIYGGAGTGKTTLLNVLADFTGKNERLVTIEDSAELRIRGVENLVRLETRKKNTEEKGEITIRNLIRTSLRMRPDRIIVGEVRGEETFDMLQAMNTGHEGSVSTGHANSADELITRLSNLLVMDRGMQLDAAMTQVAVAIDVIIGISKPGGVRKVTEISEIYVTHEGYEINNLYNFDYIEKRLVRTGSMKNRKKLDRYAKD